MFNRRDTEMNTEPVEFLEHGQSDEDKADEENSITDKAGLFNKKTVKKVMGMTGDECA